MFLTSVMNLLNEEKINLAHTKFSCHRYDE
jgi:hypothetical protein